MKFSNLWEGLKTEERDAMAKAIGTDRGYLHQIATRWRGKRPSLDFMLKMVVSDSRLTVGELAQEFSEVPSVPESEAKAP